MLEKYHDLKWNLRQFGSFKRLPLREDWSFQTWKRAHLWEWGRFLAGLQRPDFTRFLKKEREGSSPGTAATPPRSSPGLGVGDPGCAWWTKGPPAQVNAAAACQSGRDPRSGTSEPGSWRAQAHLRSPGAPCWALGLLPPLPTPAGLPLLWARSLPPTPTHVPTGKPSFWGRRVAAGRALPFLGAPTFSTSAPWLGFRSVSMVTGPHRHYSVYLFTYCCK